MIVDDLEDGARMFHSLCRFDRHVFPFVYHGCVRRNHDMEGNRAIGVVIKGSITMGGLFIFYLYTCLFRLAPL